MVRTLRAVCLVAGMALLGWALAWLLAPFLLTPAELAGAGPLLALVSGCAWLLLLCVAWTALGVLVTVGDLLRHRCSVRAALLAPAVIRRVVTVCVGVGLTGSVAGVASAQPSAPAPEPVGGPSAPALLDGLVVPDRVEDGRAVPGTAQSPSPPSSRGGSQQGSGAPSQAGSNAGSQSPTPEPAPGASAATPVPTPTPAPARTPDPGPAPAPAPYAGPGSGPHRSASTVVVRSGDTLWGLAAARLPASAGPAAVDAAWRRLYTANRPPLGGDPDLIHPGDVLRVPRDLTSEREESP